MNPAPSLQGALWSGNQQLATKKQLISSISGLYADIQDINLSSITATNLNVSTLTAQTYISTPELYVSSIIGGGIQVNNGLLQISTGDFSLVSLSSLSFKGFDKLVDLDVSFDLGLGDALGGLLGGLGALVGGGLIAVGTGAGLAIQGAEQGIATMVAGRPQNFISQTQYETINFTSQLQVSTLGNAFPAYSTVFRTVSSVSANQVPGQEIFTSTIFYPGQICIRSVSDPFNLISGDSNLNTSTIQSFGQWVALEGLEPENIIANNVSTNNLSTGNLFADLGRIETLDGYSMQFSNAGFYNSASLNYQAPLNFQTGATNMASITGDLNNLYFYNMTDFIFSRGTAPNQENASLLMGMNANESLLNVSTINSIGAIKTVDFYASTITAENLNVVSTLFLTSTNIEVITSTQTVVADNALITNASIANFVSSFSFTTPVGNPTSPFDINRTNSYVSTSYNSISSLTQNILNYNLTAQIQERTSFSPFNGQAEIYTASPQNVQQWASTMIICNPGADIGAELAFTYPSSFFTVGLTGQCDLTVDMTSQSFSFSLVQYVNESPGGGENILIPFIPPTIGFFQTYRLTCGTNGVWSAITPAPAPPITINSNVFQIYQDINDTYITATDRLHLQAGDIMFDGTLNLANVNLDTLNVDYLNVQTLATIASMSSISTATGQPTPQISQFWSSNYSPPSMLSSVTTALSTSLLKSIFQPEITRPVIYVSPGATDNITLTKLGLWLFNGVAQSSNYALGTMLINPTAFGSRIFTDNNGFGLASNLQVINLSNVSPTVATSLYIGFPSAAINIPPNSATTLWWYNSTGQWSNFSYAPWTPVTANSQFEITQSFQTMNVNTTTSQLNLNVPTVYLPNILQVNQILYNNLQPKMFRQQISGSFGGGQTDSGQTQINNGSMVFSGSLYHCQCSIASFTVGNAASAFNEVILAPYVDSGTNTWYVSWNLAVNSLATSWTISWNAFMFPNNMSSP